MSFPTHFRFYFLAPLMSILVMSILAMSVLAMSVLAVGCGPRLPPKLALPNLKIVNVGAKVAGNGGQLSYVYVGEFIDIRETSAIAVLDGKEIAPKNDVGPVVIGGVKQALKKKGFEFSDTAPVVLSGEVRNWVARVTSGFSGKVDSEASLYVEIIDPANKRIYAGVYNGFSNVESPSLGKDDVREALKTSLEEAVRQITADAQLMELLASF